MYQFQDLAIILFNFFQQQNIVEYEFSSNNVAIFLHYCPNWFVFFFSVNVSHEIKLTSIDIALVSSWMMLEVKVKAESRGATDFLYLYPPRAYSIVQDQTNLQGDELVTLINRFMPICLIFLRSNMLGFFRSESYTITKVCYNFMMKVVNH